MKKYFVIGAIIVLVAVGSGRFFGGQEILVVKPVLGEAVHAVYATGTVEPTVMLPVAPRSTARLIELKVDEGSKVSKGQVLAQLEDDELQQNIKQLQAREEFAKEQYERNATLVKTKVASTQVFEQAKAELSAAQAATRAAQAQAKYLKLIAPADGIIIKRDGEVGQTISAGTAIFWMSYYAPMRVSAEVDEEDISQLKEGQQVLIRADAFAGKIFRGKVQAITPKGDPVSRSYRVRIEFSEETPLKIGMTAETNIIIEEKKDALLIPTSSIKNNKVWLVSGGKAIQKDVKIGVKGSVQTEITEGVGLEDLVVQKHDDSIADGKTLSVIIVEQEKL